MIDWTRLNALRSEVGADDFPELVELFVSEADEAIARLAPDLGPAALEADFHTLKGSALNLGFADLAAICAEAEKAAAQGHIDVIDFDGARRTYLASKAAMLSGLDAQG